MSATYRVMLDGMAADRDAEEVAAHLVRILNLSEESARALLASRGIVVKDGLEREAAIRVRGVLERAGCVAVVNRELPRVAQAGSPAIPATSALPRVTLSPAGSEDSPQPPAAPGGGSSMATAYLAIGAALALMTVLIFAVAK